MLASTNTRALTAIAIAACCAAFPAQALGAGAAFDAVATISACEGQSLTIAAEIKPAAGKRATRVLRKVRRAQLRVGFEAMPFYGPTQKSREANLGRRTAGRRFAQFTELPANSYSGVVRYRWVRGRKTVHKGIIRTTRTRAAGRRGRAHCSLPHGKPPLDTEPPFVRPFPSDGAWKAGPLNVAFYAADDLSGVAGVFWSLTSGGSVGPIRRGRRLTIGTEGVHVLRYIARDVAGNQSRLAAVTLRVDLHPPSQPAITAPSGASGPTPQISWDASTDSASGVRAYWVLVRNAGGAIVFSRAVGASDPRTVTVSNALAPGQYTAEVIALDGATPRHFSAAATSSFSVG